MTTAAANYLAGYAALQKEDQQQVAEAIGGPDGRTRNAVWLIVVAAFAIVLLGSFGALAYGMFVPPTSAAVAKPELVMSVFTSAVGFLAGLFAPSPVQKGGNS